MAYEKRVQMSEAPIKRSFQEERKITRLLKAKKMKRHREAQRTEDFFGSDLNYK